MTTANKRTTKTTRPARARTTPSTRKPTRKATKAKPATRTATEGQPATRPGDAAAQIDAKLRALGDWRGALLGRLRALIKEADPEVVEEIKWGGVPVWSHDGILTTGETYQRVVKLTFAKGAALADPSRLFNSSLGGNTRRAIDFPEGATIDEAAFKALIREAVELNRRTRR